MNTVSSIIVGVVSGVLSSIIVFIFWQTHMPKLKISEYIAKNSNNQYRIKIINESKFCVTDLVFKLQLITTSNGRNGRIQNVREFQLEHPNILYICPYKKKDRDTKYAIRFVLPNDLEEKWSDNVNSYLKLIVYCSNEYRTAGKIFEQYFYRKDNILAGEFECGNSMNIIAETKHD